MKKTMLFIAVSLLMIFVGCAVTTPTYVYDMTWSCGNNATCARKMGAWSGDGSFTNESDCLAWETAFINLYTDSYTTSCTAVQSN